MTERNKEGYPDPTASKAIRAADRMPTHIYNAYCVINNVAGLLGLEITGLRDKKSGKGMEPIKRRRPGAFTLPAKSMKKKKFYLQLLFALYR